MFYVVVVVVVVVDPPTTAPLNQKHPQESVFVLPGSCFGAPNFFRVVFTAPQEKLGEAYARIAEFCEAHKKTGGGGGGGSGASSSS